MLSTLASAEKLENDAFTLKTHQLFFIHRMPEEFKNASLIGYLDLKSHDQHDITIIFRNVFGSH